jgi:predicted enzyme related to lactoylglutathione lyase
MGTPGATLRFKELCMDTAGGEELGRFWAEVVGCRFVAGGDTGDVVGDREYQGIAMCPVPEAKTVKHRVHLDVYGDPTTLAQLGARIVRPAAESGFGWTVMTDPEGGEFCAFEKDPLPSYRLHGIVVDSADPERIATWWAERFGVEPVRNDGWWTLEGVTPDPVLTMDFVPVPEPKSVKNRIHWDVYGDADAVLAARATQLWDTDRWRVLADPEGNEFCVFPA